MVRSSQLALSLVRSANSESGRAADVTCGKMNFMKQNTSGARGTGSGRVGLSSASPYENLFKTRHRGRGRPDGEAEPIFEGGGADPLLVAVAKRRAYSVVHEEQRDRMREIFTQELKVLKRRGVDVVARDIGIERSLGEGDSAAPLGHGRRVN